MHYFDKIKAIHAWILEPLSVENSAYRILALRTCIGIGEDLFDRWLIEEGGFGGGLVDIMWQFTIQYPNLNLNDPQFELHPIASARV